MTVVFLVREKIHRQRERERDWVRKREFKRASIPMTLMLTKLPNTQNSSTNQITHSSVSVSVPTFHAPGKENRRNKRK